MSESNNLGLPFLEAGQAQKHVTLNEALRILDAAIHLSVLAITSATPAAPAEGERHIVGTGASGSFAGHDNDVATFEDGAWRFLSPRTGWRTWVAGEDILYVFDGEQWRDLRDLAVSLDDVTRLGINTVSTGDNLLAVRTNAALLHAIEEGDGGSGDSRLQISKQAEADTASVFFSRDFEGRAEFGLVGSDQFKLKVSADGETWVESLLVDPASGTVALPLAADLGGRISLSGDISPSQITANANNYDPSGFASAAVLRLSTDATRELTGLAGGADGRVVVIQNTGTSSLVLKNESASSSAANRFAMSADATLAGKQCAILQYDATASRWRALAVPGGGGTADLAPVYLAIAKIAMKQSDINNNVTDYMGMVSDSFDTTTGLNTGGSANMSTAEAGAIKPTPSWSAAYPSSGGLAGLGISATTQTLTYFAGSAANFIDGSQSNVAFFNNGQSAGSITFDAGAGNVQYWEEYKWRQNTGAANGTWLLEGSPDNAAWTTEHSGAALGASADTTVTVTTPAATRYKRLRLISGTTSDTPFVREIEAKHASSAPSLANMTAISAAFALSAEPDNADIAGIVHKGESATVNTDYKAHISIDGGSTYAEATLEETGTVGSYTVFRTSGLDVSAQTGTSLRWKLTTHNNKNVKFTDVFVRAY